jgi:hypothetical protein
MIPAHTFRCALPWSAGDVLEMFAPSDETIEAVRSWRLESGVESDRIRLTSNKGWIEVTATLEEAEHLLQTEYNTARKGVRWLVDFRGCGSLDQRPLESCKLCGPPTFRLATSTLRLTTCARSLD